MLPDLSVIIPVFNRGDIIKYTLESVRRASAGLTVETVVVDDGSDSPTGETLTRLGFAPNQLIRQSNRGLLFARLAGLERATGRHVLFLDSDDLVGPDKFRLQLNAMESTGAEISYTDTARCTLEGAFDSLKPVADAPALDTVDGTEFCLVVQPAPHSPIFRTDWLRQVVTNAFFPPSPLYNPVAEIWFYHNAAPRTARAVKVAGPHTIIGSHPGTRLTCHWEKLGVASLAVMEAFARSCPVTPETARARRFVGEVAFRSWRALPKDFSASFQQRMLSLWMAQPDTPPERLGGAQFTRLARWLGPVAAARLLRRLRGHTYASCRTLDDPGQVEKWLQQLPVA